MRPMVKAAAAGVLGAALLVGCSSADPGMPGLTASPTTTPTPTAAPSPTGVLETSDLDLGIVYDETPDVAGDEADVYNWVAVYEKEYWRTMTTNEVGPAFDVIASPELKASLQALAQSNVDDKWVVDGTLHVTIDSIVVQGDTATASVCRDYAETTASEDGRAMTLEESGAATPLRRDLTLQRVAGEGRWVVQTNVEAGTC